MEKFKTTAPVGAENKNDAICARRANANETQTTTENATGESESPIVRMYFAIHNAAKSGEELTRKDLLKIYSGNESELDRDREKLLKFLKHLDAMQKGGEQ